MVATRTKQIFNLTEQPRPWAAGVSDARAERPPGCLPGEGTDRYRFHAEQRPPGPVPSRDGLNIGSS